MLRSSRAPYMGRRSKWELIRFTKEVKKQPWQLALRPLRSISWHVASGRCNWREAVDCESTAELSPRAG